MDGDGGVSEIEFKHHSLNKRPVHVERYVARLKLVVRPMRTSDWLTSANPIRLDPIFFTQTLAILVDPWEYVVTILKSVRILVSVSADADENVPTMLQTTGRTATIRIAAATTPVISIMAETKVSEAKVSDPVREVHPVLFHLGVLCRFLLFCRHGGELDAGDRRRR